MPIAVLLTVAFWPRLQVGLASRRLFSRDHAVRTEAAAWLVDQGELGRRALETVGFSAEFTAPGTEFHAARDAALDALWRFERTGSTSTDTGLVPSIPEPRLVRYLAEGLGVRSCVFVDLDYVCKVPLSDEVIAALGVVTKRDPAHASQALQFLVAKHERDPRVWPVLRSALDHPDENIRYCALGGLCSASAVDIPTLRTRLSDEVERVRVYAAFHLAFVLGSSEGLETLRNALRAGLAYPLLMQVARGLQALDDRASIEALVALYDERPARWSRRAEAVLEEVLQSLTRRRASPEEGWSDWWQRNKADFPRQIPLRRGG